MLYSKILKPLVLTIYTVINSWRAYNRKQRSERALTCLNDYLLDDIGLQRVDDKIVPIHRLRKNEHTKAVTVGKKSGARVRHPYLLRRREE